jgi:hypothetical protein
MCRAFVRLTEPLAFSPMTSRTKEALHISVDPALMHASSTMNLFKE